MCKCGCEQRAALRQEFNRLEFVRRLVNPDDTLRNRVILRPMPNSEAMSVKDVLRARLEAIRDGAL